jgi:FkbM family methyltransferase
MYYWNMIKSLISKLFSLFNLSIIKKDKLTKIDIERKNFEHENDMFKFIYQNDRIKEPDKIFSLKDRSESQIFQDLFVLNELNFKENGYFVEIGAADGKYLSNTYLLEKNFNWDGLVVEPAKIWESRLKKNRNSLVSLDCVHSESNISIEFNETEKPEFSRSNINNKIEKDLHEYLRIKNNTVYELNTLSINDLFAKYNVGNRIDYLSIDTEGTEFIILNSLDFDKYDISIITVEHNYTLNREKLYNLLTKKGYTRVQDEFSKVDDWYVKNLS